jgi:hypothetical protein
MVPLQVIIRSGGCCCATTAAAALLVAAAAALLVFSSVAGWVRCSLCDTTRIFRRTSLKISAIYNVKTVFVVRD